MANDHPWWTETENGKEEVLNLDLIKRGLSSSLFGVNIVYHTALGSTNDLAKDLALRGAPEGTVVVTEEQTAGKGRRGRSWLAPSRTNLLFSILLRPALSPNRAFSLTMALALAALEATERETGVSCMIKWPNDLYVGRRKLGGILTEFAGKGKHVDWVVLGLGLNVNWCPEEEKGVSGFSATSIFAETQEKFSRNELLVQILKQFESHHEGLFSGGGDELYRKWNEHSLVLGKEVVIEAEEKRTTGKAIRIDKNGALILEDGTGRVHVITHGDVSLRLFSPLS
jgi:BirA family transcriptional regulator, biotin operon repressor / biotin---[acetyl-CoA-carboxylase] ligase